MAAKRSSAELAKVKSAPADSRRAGKAPFGPSRSSFALSKKLAVSFEGALADQVQRAAEQETRGNVSAWLAEAARQKLRQQALGEAVAAYEAEHGAITADELAEVDRLWPRG
jgi:hypothetical protein